jgi:hypothetical protein
MLPIYKITIDDNDAISGFTANSIVDMPAHGKGFLMFNKTKKFAFNEEKRVVMGVAISVNTPIYRSAGDGMPEHFVLFDRQTTERIALKAFKTGNIQTLNRNHQENDVYKKAVLFQSFFIDRKLGINPPTAFAGQNLQDGTWILAYKVDDDNEWNDMKSGKIGFSIEGFFDTTEVNVKTKNTMSKEKKSLFETLFGTTKAKKFESATTSDGVEVFWDGELAVGTAIFIEVDGEQVPAPEGMHSIAPGEMFPFGVVIEVDINGIVTTIEEPTEETAPDEEALKADLEQTLTEMTKQFAIQMKAQADEFTATIKKLEAKVDGLTTKETKFDATPKKVWQKGKK